MESKSSPSHSSPTTTSSTQIKAVSETSLLTDLYIESPQLISQSDKPETSANITESSREDNNNISSSSSQDFERHQYPTHYEQQQHHCTSGPEERVNMNTCLEPPVESSGFHHQSISGQQQTHSTGSNNNKRRMPECFGCHKPIKERFLLKALDQVWHEDCLKCGCCDCRLGEVGSTLFIKSNLILCKRDYLR